MENKMSFVFMLSLKEIALRRVIINLWNQPDVLVSIENICKCLPNNSNYSEEWHEYVENKVTDKLSKFEIPSDLSKQLLLIVRPVGIQIRRWKVYHERFLNKSNSEKVRVELRAPVLEKLRWTIAGMIDYRQTAEELTRCKVIDITKAYRLACLYCLEECIPSLWKELPKEVKRKFIERENISYEQNSDLPYIWPYILRGEQSKLECLIHKRTRVRMSLNKRGLFESACNDNQFAMEYFLGKSSKDEIDVSAFTKEAIGLMYFRSPGNYVPEDFPLETFGNVLCYLLSIMNYEQQMEIIQLCPIPVLAFCLEWEWQDIFLKIANLVWSFVSENEHYVLLRKMSDSFRYSNYCNPKFFHEFYTRCPLDFKKSFVDYECEFGRFFPIFFDIQDSEAIEIVFGYSDLADRVRLVSSEPILKLFYSSILKGRRQMVEVCLREATLAKEDKERVTEAFKGFLRGFGREKSEKNKEVWMKFLQVLYPKYEKLEK